MNKKIVSFVLAMVLSVGLGVSSLFAGNDNYNASGGNRSNSSVLQSSGTASNLDPSAAALADRVSQTFHYKHGILVSATAPDGTVTIYDQGKYRGTMSMQLDGTYEWSNFALYGSDYDAIVAAGGIDNFLISVGFKASQLKGGGEGAVDFDTYYLSDERKAELEAQGYTVTESTYTVTVYTAYIDGDGNTISEEEYKKLSDEDKKKCKVDRLTEDEYKELDANKDKYTKGESKVYKVHKNATDPQRLGWLDSAMDHLSKGQNYSISIDVGGSQGASCTFNIDGKPRETFAYDGYLTTQYKYEIGGMTTYSLKQGVDLAESLKTGEAQTEDKWVATVTVGGQVQGVYAADKTAGGFVITNSVSSMQYEYNVDGSIRSVYDAETSQTTHYVGGVPTSVTGPLKDEKGRAVYETNDYYEDKDGNRISNAEYNRLSEAEQKKYSNLKKDSDGNSIPVMGTIAVYKRYNNGMMNTVESVGADGSVTTTAYINNKAIVTYKGSSMYADEIRGNVIQMFDYIAEGKAPETIYIDPRITNVNWQPDLLERIHNPQTGEWDATRLSIFIQCCGWDKSEPRDKENGQSTVDYAKGLIRQSLGMTNWLSQALSTTYSDTAYSQEDIDSLDGGEKTTRLPATKYVSATTVYNHGVAYATYNSQNMDPSVARAYYLYVQDTFNLEELAKLGIDVSGITDTMSWSDFEAFLDEVMDKINEMIDDLIDQYTDEDGNIDYDALYADLEVIDTETSSVSSSTSSSTSDDYAIYTSSSTNGTTTTTTYRLKSLNAIQKLFKKGKFGDLIASFAETTTYTTNRESSFPGGTNYYTTSTSSSSSVAENKKKMAEGFVQALKALKGRVSAYFSDVKGNIVSGKIDNVKAAMASTIKGWEGTYSGGTNYSTTTTWVDPGVVGDVVGFTYFDENGNEISEDAYNELSEADKAKIKKYAILKNFKVDIGYGFSSNDTTESIYVELSEKDYRALKDKKDKGEDVSYAAAGYIGEDIDGNMVLVGVYESDMTNIGEDIDTLQSRFETTLAGNQKFQDAMAENRAKFEQWGVTDSVMQDWAVGWSLLLNQAKTGEQLLDVDEAIYKREQLKVNF